MRIEYISFTPRARIKISKRDIALIAKCAKTHYDGAVKALTHQRGKPVKSRNRCSRFPRSNVTATIAYTPDQNGTLTIWRTFGPGTFSASFRELDTCAKALENVHHLKGKQLARALDLAGEFSLALKQLNESLPPNVTPKRSKTRPIAPIHFP